MQESLYNLAFERSILGSYLFDPAILEDKIGSLKSTDFYLPAHQSVYEAMISLMEKEHPVDEEFLKKELIKDHKFDEQVMLEIMMVNPISSIDAYLNEMKELSSKRSLLSFTTMIKRMVTEEDHHFEEIGVALTEQLEDILESSSSESKERTVTQIITEIKFDMEQARLGIKKPFLETGYREFDSRIGGFVLNGLTIIAARPSMGKSSFTTKPILTAMKRGEHVVLYSLEVIDKNALNKMIAYESQEHLSDLKNGVIKNFKRFKEAVDFLEKNEHLLTIIDWTGMTRSALESDMKKRLKKDDNVSTIVIDHLLQLSLDDKKHESSELGKITKMLKRIAQNFRKSVVLITQLNRKVEDRDNKRPMLADLQGSGSIEQDGDLIIFLYRPEYYKEKAWDSEKEGTEYARLEIEEAEILIGKNRDGPTGNVKLGFKAVTASFLNEVSVPTVVEYVYEVPAEDSAIIESNDVTDMQTSLFTEDNSGIDVSDTKIDMPIL